MFPWAYPRAWYCNISVLLCKSMLAVFSCLNSLVLFHKYISFHCNVTTCVIDWEVGLNVSALSECEHTNMHLDWVLLCERDLCVVHLEPKRCEYLCRQALNKHLSYPTQQNTSSRLSEQFKVFLSSVTKHYNFQERASGQDSETYQNFTSWNFVLWE